MTKTAIADLRQIQQLALTGQKPPASAGSCPKLVGYTFTRIGGGTSYDINASCDVSTGPSPDIRSRPIKSVPLTGVTFTASYTALPTLFKVLGQGTNLTSTNTLDFLHVATNTHAIITIGTGGEIQ